MHTGTGATDNAGKVIPARGVMVPLFLTEVWPGRINQSLSPLERQLVVLQSKLVPPVIGSKKKKKKKKKNKEEEAEEDE